MTTPAMFDDAGHVAVDLRAHARSTDPETSHQAAAKVINLRDTQRRVLEILDRFGPASDEDLYAYWGQLEQLEDWPTISPSGLRTRRSELVAKGLVYDSGERGKTAAGRATIMWERHEAHGSM